MSEGELPLATNFAQDKTQKEFGNHTRNHSDKVSLLQFQCDLQEGGTLFIYMSALERKVTGVNNYKLLETRSNVSTWVSLLESRSNVSTWVTHG